eukprot:114475_1
MVFAMPVLKDQALRALRKPSLLRAVGFGCQQQVRYLNVHEYVSLGLMKEHGITTPKFKMAESAADAEASAADMIASLLTGREIVLKAQVLSGGRGLGTFKNGFKGGVHMCSSAKDAKEMAEAMIGQQLVTKQTGEAGLPCSKVLLMERIFMQREMYLSVMMDRGSQCPVIVACPEGGTSIEDLAEQNPDLILKELVDPSVGLTTTQAEKIATHLRLRKGTPSFASGIDFLLKIFDMFQKRDCTLIEINPLAETNDGEVLACDAKLNFDDNAEYRQPEVFANRDYSQEDMREVEAAKHDLNYVGLTGNIGCMVNGAGLAMSTMDIIQLKGGSPANFLDVGGSANEKQVQKAFELLDKDPGVETILVNMFGGILRCDVIAKGVVEAVKITGIKKPIVIRLQGTNEEIANKIIAKSNFDFTLASDLEDAAQKAVGIANILELANTSGLKVSFA